MKGSLSRGFLLSVVTIGFIASASIVLARPAQGTEDEIVDPDDELLTATSPTPPPELDHWAEWETWEAPAMIVKMAPYYKAGFDQDGVPVYVLEFGAWNYRGLAHLPQVELENFHKYYLQFVHRTEKEAAGNNDQGIAFICDWDGFALASYASPKALKLALTSFTAIVQFNSALKYAFHINTNFAAETFINLAKPFFGNILEKFETYGTRSELWKPALVRKIPQDQLPPKYGGNNDWKPAPL